MKSKKVLLMGNPNVGKSTVFNELTGMHQHTGNWTGKTVDSTAGKFYYKYNNYELIDLPGTYSLIPSSEEERIAGEYLLKEKYDCIVVVMDSTMLQRNLMLFYQIFEITSKVVVMLNLCDEANKRNIEINKEILQNLLGVPGEWDEELLELFDVPASLLPEVRPSSGDFGITACAAVPAGIPICGVAGDQQAALFGQCCFDPGRAKNTYGTGCFMLLHTGHTAVESQNGLVTTVAASAPGADGLEYALEGSVFVAGAVVQWLRDELGIIQNAAESEDLANSVPDSAGVVVVPAFTGLGAPYWDSEARGAIFGLTRGANRAHIARAALESMAYQVADVAATMERESGHAIDQLNVDGGASANGFLMQFQADILNAQLHRPKVLESTGLGAAFLAGLSTGFWEGTAELRAMRERDDHFRPAMIEAEREEKLANWHAAVSRVMIHE